MRCQPNARGAPPLAMSTMIMTVARYARGPNPAGENRRHQRRTDPARRPCARRRPRHPHSSASTKPEPSRGPIWSRRWLLLQVDELPEQQSSRHSPGGDEAEALADRSPERPLARRRLVPRRHGVALGRQTDGAVGEVSSVEAIVRGRRRFRAERRLVPGRAGSRADRRRQVSPSYRRAWKRWVVDTDPVRS